MTVVVVAIIVGLVLAIITLVMYNMSIHKKVVSFSNLNDKINSLNVLQNFMDTIGEYTSVDEKLSKINNIILQKFEQLKYSTIVVFDGAEYVIKASNVDEKHWDTLINLYNEDIFKDSISSATPKYVTVERESEKLPYQKMEFGRAKSAMFFPLFIDNVYVGYWLIESGIAHAFDNLDTAMLEVIKNNIVTILKTVSYQNTVENIVRDDLYSGLKTAEYLYGEGKKEIDAYNISAVCMMKIVNLEEININGSRNVGNAIISDVSDIIKESISNKYIFVRYMGPKFVIIFTGIQAEDTEDFVKDLKAKIENTEFSKNEIDEENNKKDKIFTPKLNFAITTYYKGTSMDALTKKLEEYVDSTGKESNINYI